MEDVGLVGTGDDVRGPVLLQLAELFGDPACGCSAHCGRESGQWTTCGRLDVLARLTDGVDGLGGVWRKERGGGARRADLSPSRVREVVAKTSEEEVDQLELLLKFASSAKRLVKVTGDRRLCSPSQRLRKTIMTVLGKSVPSSKRPPEGFFEASLR